MTDADDFLATAPTNFRSKQALIRWVKDALEVCRCARGTARKVRVGTWIMDTVCSDGVHLVLQGNEEFSVVVLDRLLHFETVSLGDLSPARLRVWLATVCHTLRRAHYWTRPQFEAVEPRTTFLRAWVEKAFK